MVQPSYPDQSEDMVQTPTSINASVGVHTSKNTSPFNIKGGPLSPPTSSLTDQSHIIPSTGRRSHFPYTYLISQSTFILVSFPLAIHKT